MPQSECESVLHAAITTFDAARVQTLYQVLAHEVKENRFQKIPTSCPALDQLLNGGVRVGSLTEVYGEAGAGKTQLCLQLCVNVQMPKSMDGLDGEAVFIDCESSFSSVRLSQMASAAGVLWSEQPPHDSILKRVHHQRCVSADMLRTNVMFHLEDYLKGRPQVSQ